MTTTITLTVEKENIDRALSFYFGDMTEDTLSNLNNAPHTDEAILGWIYLQQLMNDVRKQVFPTNV